MSTHDYSKPLINDSSKPNNSKTTRKVIFFSLSFIACFSLITYVHFIYIQPYPSFISSICQKSEDLPYCHALVSSLSSHRQSDGLDLLRKLTVAFLSDVATAKKLVNKEIKDHVDDDKHFQRGALLACLELMDISRDQLVDIVDALTKTTKVNANDLNTWLSAVLDNHVTCLLQLQDGTPHPLSGTLVSTLDDLISKAKVILAIEVKVVETFDVLENNLQTLSYPRWVSRRDKKLLEASGREIEADVVVAKDGSGNFTSVAAAVEAAPDKPPNGKKRYVIYVKEGVYEENVTVRDKNKLMIVGDGMDVTTIRYDLYNNGTVSTFNSATLASNGKGFILQDIGIYNTAGVTKDQAVALRVSADQSIINRCKLDAYQDTLYPHTLRQFYRDCHITGTIDFIFGYARAVLQNCTIIPRRPRPGQRNMITAQGRNSLNAHEGFSLQFCKIIPSQDLAPVTDEFPTFLGRPWGNHSTVMVMHSYLSDVIHPLGWSPWDDTGSKLKTLNYSEFDNCGPGSDTSGRVNWTTLNIVTEPEEAMPFTVNVLIQGHEWIDSSLVEFEEELYMNQTCPML